MVIYILKVEQRLVNKGEMVWKKLNRKIVIYTIIIIILILTIIAILFLKFTHKDNNNDINILMKNKTN